MLGLGAQIAKILSTFPKLVDDTDKYRKQFWELTMFANSQLETRIKDDFFYFCLQLSKQNCQILELRYEISLGLEKILEIRENLEFFKKW